MSSSLIRTAKLLGAAMIVCAVNYAAAAPLDPRYGAAVELQNLGTYLYEGQTSAGGSITTGPGGAVVTEGAAGFSNSPASLANATSVIGRGVVARAYLFDTLTFAVAGGGTADVPVRMAGRWNGAGAASVRYSLYLGTREYTGRASPTGFNDSYAGGAPVPSAFTFGSGDFTTGVIGSYLVDAPLRVADGGVYNIFAQVRVEASDGARAYMDDPLTIALPAGVTFTSASNSTYAVPEPSIGFLIGGGFIALACQRRHRLSALQAPSL